MAEDLTEQPKAFTVPPAPELAAVKGQMGGVPGVPDYAETRRRLKTSGQASEEAARQLQRLNQLDQEIGVAKLAQEQYKSQSDFEIARQKREQAQKIEQHLSDVRSKMPDSEFHPTKDNVQTLAALFSIIGVIGAGMGGAGKNSATLALNSMSGMLDGWRKGRADLFKREKEEYEKHVSNMKRILDDAYRDADRAYKTLAFNADEAQALANQAQAKLGGAVGKQILERQGVERFFQYVQGLEKGLRHKEELFARKKEADKANYQYFTDKEGQVIYFNTKNPQDFGVVKGAAGKDLSKLGAVQKEPGLPKKGESQAKFVSETIGKNVDVDTAGKLVSGLSYIDGLKELQQKNIELGNAPGLTVALADKINPLLKMQADPATGQQTIDVTQETLDDAWQRALQDKSFASLSDKSKVMAKKQLDTIMLNLQTKYGNRAPVAEFRAAQNVLSRGMASPTAFNQTMKEETDATYKRLFGLGYGMQDINKMESRLKQSAKELVPLAGAQSGLDPTTGYPLKNSRGWMLQRDASGNYAYVSPNGDIEEIE